MALSVRREPALLPAIETSLEKAGKLGIGKSELVKYALKRTWGIKNPEELMSHARTGTPMGNTKASANVRSSVKKKILAKRNN